MRRALGTKRRAFTLIEIILVVMIILIVMALSIPVMRSMLTDSRTTAAGDMVRAKLAEARSRAMEDGRPWRVGFICGTGVIQIAPEDSQEWGQTGQDATEMVDLVRDLLPPEIVFGLSMDEIAGNTGDATPGGSWETMAVYLPAGDAREDRNVYFGKTGFYPRRVSLRCLTGVATIEDPDARVLP
jgi:prepilin-type N-terminal cleavage/methylation domain-containing protein